MIKMSKFKKVIVDQTIAKTKEKKQKKQMKPKSTKQKCMGKKKQFKKLAKMNGKKGNKKWISL